MSQVISPSAKKPYGLERVCAAWELARSTVYAQKQREREGRPLRKRGPRTAWSDEQLVALIRQALADSPWVGEGHRKAWARLRAQGVRTSRARVLRLMRESGQLAQQRSQRVRGPQVHDGSIIPERPDVMWGTDMTTTHTRLEGKASIFAVVDHVTAECLGTPCSARLAPVPTAFSCACMCWTHRKRNRGACEPRSRVPTAPAPRATRCSSLRLARSRYARPRSSPGREARGIRSPKEEPLVSWLISTRPRQ